MFLPILPINLLTSFSRFIIKLILLLFCDVFESIQVVALNLEGGFGSLEVSGICLGLCLRDVSRAFVNPPAAREEGRGLLNPDED